MLYNINQSSSTFCLDTTKVTKEKSRQTRMAPPVLLANAQQHSEQLI
jgi:hypothetical protein